MAVGFYLSAECGPHESQAERFASHFEVLSLRLSTGLEVRCKTNVTRDEEGNCWVDVVPLGAGYGTFGPKGESLDPILHSDDGLSEIGQQLYRQLRTARDYRYATYSAEPEQFATYSWLMAPDGVPFADRGDGFVTCEEIWREAGAPMNYEPFSPGYLWQPFLGFGDARKPAG